MLVECLMHKVHKIVNTFQRVSKSSSDWMNSTGFPGDLYGAFFNGPPGNKGIVMPNPFMEKESVMFTTVTMRAQDQLSAGFSKP